MNRKQRRAAVKAKTLPTGRWKDRVNQSVVRSMSLVGKGKGNKRRWK